MKRKEFLKLLRQRLTFLSKEELEKEVLYYINEIDKSKKSDEEVIKSFGSIDNIVKDVCKKRGLDYKKVSKNNGFKFFQNYYNELIDLSDIFKNGDRNKRIKLLLDLLLLLVVTCVLKIPFIFVRNLGDSLFGIVFNGNIMVLAIWGLVIEILYVILALSFFMKTLKKWIKGLSKE